MTAPAPGETMSSGEITNANFGDVLLFAYAGHMRQATEARIRSSKLTIAAIDMENQAFSAANDLPIAEMSPEEVAAQIQGRPDILQPGMAGLVARKLIEQTRHTLIQPRHDFERIAGSLLDRTVTVTPISGRASNMYKNGQTYEGLEPVTGVVRSLRLGEGGSSMTFHKGMFGIGKKVTEIGNLVNSVDYRANVRLEFHEE